MSKRKTYTEDELVTWINGMTDKHKFYLSKAWRRKRADILKRDNYECQVCKSKGLHSAAVVVHHIKHLIEFPMYALTDSNLISVCKECHNDLHPEKRDKFIEYINKIKAIDAAKEQINEEKW